MSEPAIDAGSPAYLIPAQVAAMLQVSVRSICRLAANDPSMPLLKLNSGALRFPRERLEKWLLTYRQAVLAELKANPYRALAYLGSAERTSR